MKKLDGSNPILSVKLFSSLVMIWVMVFQSTGVQLLYNPACSAKSSECSKPLTQGKQFQSKLLFNTLLFLHAWHFYSGAACK